MFGLLNRLGDRMLSVMVPKATAAASNCQYRGSAGSCTYQCCIVGSRTRLEKCCIGRPCVTVGEC
jgi:hypothetical protein